MKPIEGLADRAQQPQPKRQEISSEPKKQNDDAVRVTRSAPAAQSSDTQSTHFERGSDSEASESNSDSKNERENLDRTV